jgi:L,D-peptidoglycan transpeptidase YkuD (ErfK/YbiS/YcfS/YnhG family)
MFASFVRSYSKKRQRNEPAGKNRPIGRMSVRTRPGQPAEGLLNIEGTVFRCALGRGGVRPLKREGDGATPLARMHVLAGYVRPGRRPGCSGIKLTEIAPQLGWCDAPDDRNYNRPVRMPYPARHERMARADRLYDTCIVLDYNIRPRRRGRGSAIFLHIARPGFAPTEGCIAVSPRLMKRLVPRLSPHSVIDVVR